VAAVLVGNAYIGPSSQDPGSVGFGYDWKQTDTGNIYTRNLANSGWVLVGNAGQVNLGLAPVSGFTATGGISGSHGLMPTTAATPFTANPYVNGDRMALMTDITDAVAAINENISAVVNQQLASVPSASIRSNLVSWSGQAAAASVYSNPLSIPILGTYPDGSVPIESECIVFVSAVPVYVSTDQATQLNTFLNAVPGHVLQWVCYTSGHAYAPCPVRYTVIAIKANA